MQYIESCTRCCAGVTIADMVIGKMRIHLLSCFMVLALAPIYSASETMVVQLDTNPPVTEDIQPNDDIVSEERVNHLLQPAREIEDDESDLILSKKPQAKAKEHNAKYQKINRFFPDLFTPNETVEVTGSN